MWRYGRGQASKVSVAKAMEAQVKRFRERMQQCKGKRNCELHYTYHVITQWYSMLYMMLYGVTNMIHNMLCSMQCNMLCNMIYNLSYYVTFFNVLHKMCCSSTLYVLQLCCTLYYMIHTMWYSMLYTMLYSMLCNTFLSTPRLCFISDSQQVSSAYLIGVVSVSSSPSLWNTSEPPKVQRQI
jgi:hypothetical protein